MALSATTLILNADGSIYHLHLRPEELAKHIVLVGDPDRVDAVAQHFEQIEFTRQHREFRACTGVCMGKRITCLSTGIGTDNIDIVLNELDALVNIDFATREVKPRTQQTQLHILRLGTCGGMQPAVAVGSLVASQYAIGTDGLLNFYAEHPTADEFSSALSSFFQEKMPTARIFPYGAASSLPLSHPDIQAGITFTANGFYAPQGRDMLRTKPIGDMPSLMADFTFADLQVLNMEMETAGILGLSALLGHKAASLSVILANRPLGIFHENPAAAIERLIAVGLPLLLRA